MTRSQIRASVVAERLSWIRTMLEGIRHLPLSSFEEFVSDPRNTAAAESYLRRALEALLDLGRHVLAKGFGLVVTEYRDIGARLEQEEVLDREKALKCRRMAGYRNRMVHFYHELSNQELFEICSTRLHDVEGVADAIVAWLSAHDDMMGDRLD